ncbi:DNA-binding protein [Parashewanella curva]|uniref:DNA-binding protein n=1 Tax=Parashewanella curva TaxID=2338552 RepID=A0A3L8PSY6_9GAMM|nr:DNA-binding protein [Parashewanella curva]RLV58364.1 DNA-binding protein [Parashewanella curva]
MSDIAIQIASPFVTYEEYAKLSGVPYNTIKKMAADGRLPIRPKLKRTDKPLINLLALTKEAAELITSS